MSPITGSHPWREGRLARSLRLALAGWAGFAFCAPSAAWSSDFATAAIGTTGSEFLNFDVGARGISMGGAYTAVTDDAYSLYWNPAGLTRIPRLSMAFMYSPYVQDISYQSAYYAQRVNDTSVVAVGLRYLDLGSINYTDNNAVVQSAFNPRDYVFEVGWAQSIYDLSDSDVDLSLGLTGRWIRSIMVESAYGYGGDLGLLAHFVDSRFDYDLAAVAQNFGVGEKFDQQRNTLPTQGKFGGDIRPSPNFIIAADAVIPINNQPYFTAGFEYTLLMQESYKGMLRFGFNGLDVADLGFAAGLNVGVGLKVSDFSFDYAFTPMGVLGEAHRFSISYNLPAKMSSRYRER
jgi:hypothetical protein